MIFADDTELALIQTAALVNTRGADGDALVTLADLDVFLGRYPMSGVRRRTTAELQQVLSLRERLAAMWGRPTRDEAAQIVNGLLRDVDAKPYLSKHDQWDWHLHVTTPDAPLAQRLSGEAAMAFLDLVRSDEVDRLKTCAAADCEDVLVDMSKNKSKRYCDTGNCGNRSNVAAYRARKRAATP